MRGVQHFLGLWPPAAPEPTTHLPWKHRKSPFGRERDIDEEGKNREGGGWGKEIFLLERNKKRSNRQD